MIAPVLTPAYKHKLPQPVTYAPIALQTYHRQVALLASVSLMKHHFRVVILVNAHQAHALPHPKSCPGHLPNLYAQCYVKVIISVLWVIAVGQ